MQNVERKFAIGYKIQIHGYGKANINVPCTQTFFGPDLNGKYAKFYVMDFRKVTTPKLIIKLVHYAVSSSDSTK